MQSVLYLYCNVGADLGFDGRILTDYFASRRHALSALLIATLIAKAKTFVSDIASGFASAFQMPVLATARI